MSRAPPQKIPPHKRKRTTKSAALSVAIQPPHSTPLKNARRSLMRVRVGSLASAASRRASAISSRPPSLPHACARKTKYTASK